MQPRLKSESVLEMAVKPCGDGRYLLSYDPQYASPTDINKIEVLYLFGGARVSQTIFFNPAGDAVSVRPKGTLRIEQSGGVIRGTMQLRVSGTAAEVRRIVLFNPADGAGSWLKGSNPRSSPGRLQRNVRGARLDKPRNRRGGRTQGKHRIRESRRREGLRSRFYIAL